MDLLQDRDGKQQGSASAKGVDHVPENDMSDPLSVLIVEDQSSDFDLLVRELRRAGIHARCHRVDTEAQYRIHLQAKPDIILADYRLPGFGAARALELLEESSLDIPLIAIAGLVSEETMVGMHEAGRRALSAQGQDDAAGTGCEAGPVRNRASPAEKGGTT